MLLSIIISYLPYALITAFTPGPNNCISFYSVSHSGWRKGKNVLLGIAVGFLCVMVICAIFCYELTRYIPAAAGVLKYIGAAYIIWLGIHVALSKPEDGDNKPMSFWKGFWLEFVNIKIVMYAVTVYTGYVLPHDTSLTSLMNHAVCLTVIGVAGTLTWAAAGNILQKYITKYYRCFNITMALILFWCALSMAFGI